ncbi:MAG: hypothetical protein ACI31V_01225 [Bacilli bacterium]
MKKRNVFTLIELLEFSNNCGNNSTNYIYTLVDGAYIMCKNHMFLLV